MPGSAHTWVDGDVATAAFLNALPRGVMAYVLGSTADQAGISGMTDITGLSATFTAISSRIYKTEVIVATTQQSGAGIQSLVITDSGGTQLNGVSQEVSAWGHLKVEWLETSLSGSITRKARISTNVGTMTVRGSSTVRGVLLITDVGV